MSVTSSRSDIVVGVDGSPASHCAVDWAARDAALRNVGLNVVHVVKPLGIATANMPVPAGLSRWQERNAQKIVDEAVAVARRATADGGPAGIESEVISSPVVPALVDLSKDARMVVVGSRGRGALARTILGSVSSDVIRHAHCPVAIIHDEDPLMEHPATAPVLVGVDGSPASEKAIAVAFEEASLRGVELVALHVWSDIEVLDYPELDWPARKPDAEETLAERLAGWQEWYPDVAVQRAVECCQPTHHLVTMSESAQLVVVGSHGLGGFSGMLLGSVSAAVAQASRMPVIVARD